MYHYIKANESLIVDYHSKKQQGYFIGSAFAEKTIDLLICRRLKLRGQNWSRKGADNIVAFRQLILNDPWETHWQQKTAG